MSRHRLVKNLDLENELDAFDGGEDYDDDDVGQDISEEDKESLRQGTIQVREVLGDTMNITEAQIHEALWHYYYDIDKTVGYLLNILESKAKKEQKKAASKKKTTDRMAMVGVHHGSFLFANFFKDTPWLNIPLERCSVLIPPSHPKVGLLGGSSGGAPKVSKLQALAAARKKKAQEQRTPGQKPGAGLGLEEPMKELHIAKEQHKSEPAKNALESSPGSKQQSRSLPLRKRKDSNPHEKALKAPPIEHEHEEQEPNIQVPSTPVDQAEPSAFANTMFSSIDRPHSSTANLFTLPYVATISTTATNPFAGPSPDDVVFAAQSKASKKGGKGPPKTNGEKKADQIANGVDALKLEDTPRATSKNLEVLKEYEKLQKKNEANFVVIGHVDAGKSTMMGRLLYDLNIVDQRTLDRYRKDAEKLGKSSFALAWVLDQGTEERSRGVTIDIAMNKFSTSKTKFTILDAPGHKDFVPNMIAGASQADFAVLVIDASTGSFESGLQGQTKEHALLARSMGIQRIIIAVNKLDMVDWSQNRFDEISQQISAFLISANFQTKNITFIPCSGLQGDNIVRKSTETRLTTWYTGGTLIEELENSEPISRALTKPLRLTIGDVFRGGVQNPLSVSGRVEAGSLQIGDILLAQPSGEKCYIKGIDVDEEPADWAVAGQNVILHLVDIDPAHLRVGDVLCTPSSPIQNVRQFTAKVLAFGFLTPMKVDVHRGRLHVPGNVKELVGLLDKGSGMVSGKKKPRIIKPGQVARVVVELESAVPLETGARVVLRDEGETIASGILE
ncbi:P-loop containing nucleoside triphosphate hydrolase protein [Bisporella sp. PMI_857]|nr:P-loop containing nucleoside triphosphate hydrolase protein [Bisporella sp. PMI_857]